jgi:hypothetical protein
MPTIKIIPLPGPQGPSGATGPTGPAGEGMSGIRSKVWGYPTPNGVAIYPDAAGESIAVKSSNSAALRWHIRDGGASVVRYSIEANSIIEQTGEQGVGPFQVKFAISTEEFPPPVGYTYGVDSGTPWDGAYLCTDSTVDTLTLEYPGTDIPGPNEAFTGGSIYMPSVYNQVEARQDGIYVKNANWSEPDGYWYNWKFGTDGLLHFPDGSTQSTAYAGGTSPTFENVEIDGTLSFYGYDNNTDPVYALKENVGDNTSTLKIVVGDDGGANVNDAYPTSLTSDIHADGFAIATTNAGVHHYMNVAGDYYLAGKVVPTDGVQFADGSVQTSAYPTQPVPANHVGQSGDKKGMIAVDTAYIYFCTQDYNGNGAAIWRRIATDPNWNW